MMDTFKNKEVLYDLYINKCLSLTQIGDMFNVDHKNIHYWTNKFGIKMRGKSESIHLAKANHCLLSKEAKDFIYGELLGDMYSFSQSKYSAGLSYASKYYEYIKWLSDTLSKYGVDRTGKINNGISGYGTISYYYSSLVYVELKTIRDLFYPNGVKIIPDIEFNPLTLRQWYIGDGSLLKGNKNPIIALYTTGFDKKYVELAVSKLNDLGFGSARWPSNNAIGVGAESVQDFLNYIGQCPVECYKYKWALS